MSIPFVIMFSWHCHNQGRPGPPGTCQWAGWSAGHVGCHVKCWRREWNGGGAQWPFAREGGLSSQKLFVLRSPRAPSYATAHGAGPSN